MAYKICIDPGHGGSDPGAVGNGFKEKDLTLKLALFLRDYLAADQNYEPVMTRSTDINPSVNERATFGNNAKAALFMSIHFNSASGTSGTGFEVYPHVPKESYHAESVTLAKAIVTCMKDMQAMRGTNGCGIRYCYNQNGTRLFKEFTDTNSNNYSTYYGVVRQSNRPAILIETAFINNPADIAKFNTDDKLKAAAYRYYQAICDYFKTSANSGGSSSNSAGAENTTGGTLYRVQVGAFSIKSNADKLMAELKAKGYSTIIK